MKLKLNSLALIWFVVICAVFAFPYFYLSSLVGKFPAEALDSGDVYADYRPLFCMGSQSLSFSLDQQQLKSREYAESSTRAKVFNNDVISKVEYIDNSKKIPITFILNNRNVANSILNNIFIGNYKYNTEGDLYSNYLKSSILWSSDLFHDFLMSKIYITPAIYILTADQPYFSENLYQLQWSLGSIRALTDGSLPSAPISLHPAIAKRLSDVSDSLYFSNETMRIYAQDKIDTIPLAYLWMMKQEGELLDRDLASLYSSAQEFYSPCITPIVPRGLTEGYWASKGTSVLHHWVHLYEAVVPGGPKLAQYGYLVPNLAQQITRFQGVEGPTAFVRTAWFIFCILGIVYIVLFFLLFPENIFVTSLFLLAQIYSFFLIKQFYLLLAPGYHWFRELVIIVLPLFFITLFSCSINKDRKIYLNNKLKFCVFFSIVVLCYCLEPLYTLLSLACIVSSYLWCNKLKISELLISQKKFKFSFVAVAGLLPALGVIFYGTQKLAYIADKLSNGDFGLFNIFESYRLWVFFLMFISLIALFSSESSEKSFRLNYFALISVFIAIYYFVLPDDAHFIKYIEFYIIFLAAVYYEVSLNLKKINFSIKNCIYRFMQNGFVWIDLSFQNYLSPGTIKARLIKCGAQTAVILILAGACYNQVIEIDYAHPERMYLDSWSGKPYFSSDKIEINNRIIYADISEAVIKHLRSFPDEVKSDFVISSYDKYLVFLYDHRNGFAAPDFSSWLNSAKRKDEILEQISTTEKPLTIIFDLNDLEVDARVALLKGNVNFKNLAKASELNMKSKFRMAELINHFLKHCHVENDQIRTDWAIGRCQGRR